jgi:hypothetical protein
MSSRKVLSTLVAGLVMASLATSLVEGTAAAAVDGHRIHHVHKTYATHRLYNYARPAPYTYDSARKLRSLHHPDGIFYKRYLLVDV